MCTSCVIYCVHYHTYDIQSSALLKFLAFHRTQYTNIMVVIPGTEEEG